jgi:hypothetical protein
MVFGEIVRRVFKKSVESGVIGRIEGLAIGSKI